ncbi:MAG: CRTAC1 family protein [Deltaproteobacteria bacterium]|nr:CRTAC1 family protein [Deltaproteobacteria bacterium]
MRSSPAADRPLRPRGCAAAAVLGLLGCAPPKVSRDTSAEEFAPPDSAGGDGGSPELTDPGAVVCADPGAREREGAFVPWDRGPDWALQRPRGLEPTVDHERAAGVLVEDLNEDGLLDVFLTAELRCQLLWGAADGSWLDAGPEALPEGECKAWGVSAADADADGDLDLFLARDGAVDRLWRNEGDRFTAPTALGLDGPACGSRSGSWGDMDGDGDLDLFVARHHVLGRGLDPCPAAPELAGWSIAGGDPNDLYENLGDGSFASRSEVFEPAARWGYTFIGGWLDLDADGDQDLYQINDYGGLAAPNLPLLNDGAGSFSLAPPGLGLQVAGDNMSLAVGDLNDDRLPDLAVADIDAMHLLLSDGAGGYYDAAVSRGLVPDGARDQRAGWGTELADLDNDGLLDVLTVYGPTEGVMLGLEPGPLLQPDAVWMQGPDGSFVDRARALGLDGTTNGRGLIVADLDDDGWLDILKVDYRGGPAQLWRQRCGEAAWLTVRLEGPPGNPRGLGARVELEAGGRRFVRWQVQGNSGLASQGPGALHFGLGQVDEIDALRVIWPDGRVDELGPVGARRALVVRRGG